MTFRNEFLDIETSDDLEVISEDNRGTYYQKILNGTAIARIRFTDKERRWIYLERVRRKKEVNPEFNVTGIQLEFLSPAGKRATYRYHPQEKKLSVRDFIEAIKRVEKVFMIELEKDTELKALQNEKDK